jgi:hypothetical protein
MQLVFRKKLTLSERRRHYVRIPPECRNEFPGVKQRVKVKAGKTFATVEIDDQWRMHIGARLLSELEAPPWWVGTVILTVKKGRTVYHLSLERVA